MKHHLLAKISKVLILVLCSFVSVRHVSAQTVIGRQNVDQFPINPGGTLTYGLTYLPSDYNSNSNSYPLIIFLHGIGEVGTGASGLYSLIGTGLPQLIANGFDPQAVNPADGKTYKFIVVSPQAPQWSYGFNELQYILPNILSRYRIDPSRVYITGLSAGGAGTWGSVTNTAAFSQKITAVVPVCAAGTNTSTESNNMYLVGGTFGVKSWTICGTQDSFWNLATGFTNTINTASPAPSIPALVSGLAGYTHNSGAWNTIYDPNWKTNSNNTYGLSIYEWMLKYSRGGSTSSGTVVSNQTPVVNAGTNQTITLPANTASLNGSATGTPGSVVSYNWSEVSGPAQYSFSNTSIANPTLSNLAAGTYTFRLTATSTLNGAQSLSASATVVITVNTAAPATYTAIPAKIEAETFSAMNGVQTETTSDAGGGQDVGYIDNSDWMDYPVNAPSAGTYTINFRIAAPGASAQFQVRKADGTVLATVTVPNTGGYQNWQTTSASVTLPAGQQILRIVSTGSTGWNINWLQFASSALVTPVAVGSTIHIEAENFAAMSGVQTETTSDAGGGQDVGWIDNGDWMDYSLNPSAAGTYTINFRVASPNTNAQFQLKKADGTLLTTVNVPNTAGYQQWQTVSASVSLAAGQQTVRIVSTGGGGWNFNWIDFASSSATAAITTATASSSTIHVEAEAYAAMNGVQTETTSDAGGGQDVGYIDNADWMDYSVNPSAAGTYTLNFRVASPNTNAQFQLRKADGTLLTTVNVPNTGGYQQWQTISASVSLSSGQQTLRIVSTGGGGWNFNWMDLVSPGALSGIAANTASSSFDISPATTQDKFVLQVNNNYTGTMDVQIIDVSGVVKKDFPMTKDVTGSIQTYLSIGDLPAGTYTVRATMLQWSDSKQIVKQ